jgi:hypothetical protein
MPHGDIFPTLRYFAQILADSVVKIDFAVFDQQHQGCRRKLFAD